MDRISLDRVLTNHFGQSSSGLSPRLWSRVRSKGTGPDGSAGFFFGDDFLNFYPVTVTTAAGQLQPGGGYFAYIEADATVGSIGPVADKSGGVIKLLTSKDTADGDNHQTVLTTGGNAGTMGAVSDTAGSDKLTIFEARVMLPSVTNGDGSIYVGTGEEGLAAAATPLLDSTGHKTADKDLIGFAVFEDDNDSLDFVYRKAGQAVQTPLTYGTALSAATWYKLGWVYDPQAPASKRLSIYIDNEEQTTYVTASDIAATTFPDGEELALVASIINSADNDPQNFLMDWWAFYQEA